MVHRKALHFATKRQCESKKVHINLEITAATNERFISERNLIQARISPVSEMAAK